MSINFYKMQIEKNASDNVSMHDKRMGKIIESGKNTTLLEISYRDKKGNRTKRYVEPYKLTESDFWGFDITKGEIRRFKKQNIKGIKMSNKTFQPRWDIQV